MPAGENVPVIAIDGPVGSGKGTVAHRVAAALGFPVLDSGALYRILALVARIRGASFDDPADPRAPRRRPRRRVRAR